MRPPTLRPLVGISAYIVEDETHAPVIEAAQAYRESLLRALLTRFRHDHAPLSLPNRSYTAAPR